MGTFVYSVLFFVLGVLVLGHQENEGSSLDENVRVAVSRAVHWLKDQRQEDYSWGDFTPRAVVALSLAHDVVPISKDEMTIMTKQLNILLSLELGRNLSTKSMRLSRLALYVNALYATCQDPRNFHGHDLVRILRSRTDSALVDTTTSFSLPVVFIPLCLAQDVTYQDVHNIIGIYQKHINRTDLQALFLLGLSCIAQHNRTASVRHYAVSLTAEFKRHFDSIAHSSDVYTLALALQALRAVNGSRVDVNSLIEMQSPDGSFGSLLGTYYALPALLGRSIFTIKDNCSNEGSIDRSLSYTISEPSSPKVYYSVWIGEGDARDSHTVTVTFPSNGTFLEVMQMAQSRNPNFRFSYEERNGGKHVYSVGGTPDDVQRELYWMLYKTKGEPNGIHPQTALQLLTKGVDKIHPAPEDHYIFWFRRHSSY